MVPSIVDSGEVEHFEEQMEQRWQDSLTQRTLWLLHSSQVLETLIGISDSYVNHVLDGLEQTLDT